MNRIFISVFILVAFAQWFVPAKMIWKKQNVLDNGKAYKFQTQPIDPVNPFQGRYVALNFKENSYRVLKNHGLSYGQTIYIEPGVDSLGYAYIKRIVRKPPEGTDYIQANVDYINDWDSSGITVFIKYPFEEFYMEEFKAPRTERIYRDSATDHSSTYALVKIYKGDCVIQDLYFNDKKISDILQENTP